MEWWIRTVFSLFGEGCVPWGPTLPTTNKPCRQETSKFVKLSIMNALSRCQCRLSSTLLFRLEESFDTLFLL